MKRFSFFILLMLLSSTAHARQYSFSIGGHRIHIEAGRYCRSLSCVSWSEGGLRRTQRDDDVVATPVPAKPVATLPACPPAATAPAPAASAPAPVTLPPPTPAPAPAQVRIQVVPPVQTQPPAPAPAQVKPPPMVVVQAAPPIRPADTVASIPPSKTTIGLAAANTQPALAPKTEPAKPVDKNVSDGGEKPDMPGDTPEWAKDLPSPVKDAPAPAKAAAKPAKAIVRDEASPVGDWQTEGKKGLVRIEKCGAALCGYLLNEATNTTGETVLSNMKPKTDAQWSGDIFSRSSGNTYYAKMTFRQPDKLRVEACAFSRFFCSGNNWTRVVNPDEMISSREQAAAPKS